MSFNSNIICGFPCVGKSEFYKKSLRSGIYVTDSDSSHFSWESPGVRSKDFPKNYVDHLEEILPYNHLILCSTHKLVIDELKNRDVKFTLVYPLTICKEEYLERASNRGSTPEFVNMLDKNWDNFIQDLDNADAPSIRLNSGEYLSDITKYLKDQKC